MTHLCRALWLLALVTLPSNAVSTPPTPDEIRNLIGDRRYEDAVAAAAQLHDHATREDGEVSLEAADALELEARARAIGRVGTLSERLAPAMRAVDIRRQLVDADDIRLAEAIYVVGLVHNLAGDPVSAFPHFEEALAIAEKSHAPLDPELEVFVREYGVGLYGVQRFEDAKVEFTRLDTICREKYGVGHPGTLKAIFNLALITKILGHLEKAETLYIEAIAILEAQDPVDVGAYAWTLDSYSTLLHWQGRLFEGLQVQQRALDLRREHLGSESWQVASSLANLARSRLVLGDYAVAETELLESLRIQDRIDVAPDLAFKTRVNLAVVYRERGQYEQSQEWFRASEEHKQQPSAWFHTERAELYLAVGERSRARSEFLEALRILEETLGREHYDYVDVSARLSKLDLADNRLQSSRDRLLGALASFERLVGQHHPEYASALDSLATVYFALGDKERAFRTAIEAESRMRAIADTAVAALSERQALAHAALPRNGANVALSIAIDAASSQDTKRQAFDAVVLGRARVFDEIVARNRWYRQTDDPELTDKLKRLRELRANLANLFVLGPGSDPERYLRLMHENRQAAERLESDIAHQSLTHRARLASRAFDLRQLRTTLPGNSVIVSFVRYSRRQPGNASVLSYAAFLQRAGAESVEAIDLGPADPIDAAIARWHDAAREESGLPDQQNEASRTREGSYRRAGVALRRILWDPLVKRLDGESRLLVVPDGPVHLVSFGSLPDDETGYLVESAMRFHYLTAERDLSSQGATEIAAAGELLVVGDPAFDGGRSEAVSDTGYRGPLPGCQSFTGTQFERLPGTRTEASLVERVWRSVEVEERTERVKLMGRRATETAVREHAPGKRVIHLATHGYFLGEKCGGRSAARGAGGLARFDVTTDLVNPLLLSGIVLAGANRRSERRADGADDGILTAEEISTLELQGVELTVVTSCRGGSGSVFEGEGVFGLRRAFLTAGVKTFVTSLWDVDDESAPQWVDELYSRRFLDGGSIADSMRGASLKVLSSRREAGLSTHPYYWGGWVAVGRPD